MSMKLSVIGCGYLGAAHTACMAEFGHEVVGIDIDDAKIPVIAEASRRSSSRGGPNC